MKSHKILFIGNSFTFYGKVGENAPRVINDNHPRFRLVSDVCYKGGANLKSHFEKEADNPLEKIKTGSYDLVVIQGGADLIEQVKKQVFREYLPIFIDAIRASGALPVLTCPWGVKGRAEITQANIEMYREAYPRFDTVYVPIGEAWLRGMSEEPDWLWGVDDVFHPGSIGVYLNLCVYYSALTGETCEGLEFDVETIPLKEGMAEQDPERFADKDSLLNDDKKRYLQKLAWETVQPYVEHNRRMMETLQP